MTLIEAITKIDSLKHNTYDKATKIRWLSTLDGQVKRHIFDTHAGEPVEFAGYGVDTPPDTVLLVPAPYDELYLWWLAAQMDYHNGEFTRYNNSIQLFNTGYSVFAEVFTREHKPLSVRPGFF